MTGKKTKKMTEKTTRGLVVFVKVLNAILAIFSVSNLFLLMATAGAWMQVLEGIFVDFATSEPYKINLAGVLIAALMAFLLANLVAMFQVKGKNYVEIGSLVVNLGFLLFIAFLMTANISAFPFIFCGLGLAFSIIMTLLVQPKNIVSVEIEKEVKK